MTKPLAVSQYAKTRGVSHVAVIGAIKSGRLSKSVVYDAKGHPKIADVALADKEWVANTDQSKPLNSVTGSPKLHPGPGKAGQKSAPPEPVTNDAGAGGGGGGGPSYAQSRAIREAYMARLAKLDFDEKSGKLLEADKVRVASFNAARAARDMLLAVPDRVAPLVTGVTDQHEINRVLTDEMRRVCVEIAKLKF